MGGSGRATGVTLNPLITSGEACCAIIAHALCSTAASPAKAPARSIRTQSRRFDFIFESWVSTTLQRKSPRLTPVLRTSSATPHRPVHIALGVLLLDRLPLVKRLAPARQRQL